MSGAAELTTCQRCGQLVSSESLRWIAGEAVCPECVPHQKRYASWKRGQLRARVREFFGWYWQNACDRVQSWRNDWQEARQLKAQIRLADETRGQNAQREHEEHPLSCPLCGTECEEVEVEKDGWFFAFGELWFVVAALCVFSFLMQPAKGLYCPRCDAVMKRPEQDIGWVGIVATVAIFFLVLIVTMAIVFR